MKKVIAVGKTQKFMERQSDIARGFSKGEKLCLENLWKDLTKELNSLGPPLHDMSGWKKVWCDWKVGVKKKIAMNNLEARANQVYIPKKDENIAKFWGLYTIVGGIKNAHSFGTTKSVSSSSDEEEILVDQSSE